MTTEKKEQTPKKEKKPKGPIRWEALIPFSIVSIAVFAYFHFFFDLNLRQGFQWAGYHIVGAEVDIADVDTSFFKGTFAMKKVEVTNPDKPSHNLIEIGDIRFGLLWDGLLRAKVVIEEMAVEKIEIGTSRKFPGKVKPPEPPPTKKEVPSALEKEATKLKEQALEKTKKAYSQNVLGDIAAMLSGTSSQDQLGKIEDSLPSKAKLKEFETTLKEKQKQWNEKIKSLPQGKEIQELSDRFSKVKTKDFKTPQEFQQSAEQIKSILEDADKKVKTVQKTNDELNTDIKSVDQQFKELDALIKKDIKDLESRFRLPQLDAKSISMSLFHKYLDPYLAKFNYYKGLAEKYVPPNLMKKSNKDEVDVSIQPRPRAKGLDYEFGRQNSYPAFWIKKIAVTSKAGASANAGDIEGKITDITSNQVLIGRPTVAELKGSFPGLEILGMDAKITIDNTQAVSRIGFDFSLASYLLSEQKLIQSADVEIGFLKAQGSLKTTGQLVGLQELKFNLDNKISKIDYKVAAKNDVVDTVVKAVFSGIPVVSIDASGDGQLPNVALDIRSNLGSELQKGFEAQLRKKVDEAKAKLQAYVDEQVGKERAKVEAEINKIKTQVDGEVKKAQEMLSKEKAKGEQQIATAKKESENSAKKQIEDQIKKAAGPDGEKKLEDLKKKFGL